MRVTGDAVSAELIRLARTTDFKYASWQTGPIDEKRDENGVMMFSQTMTLVGSNDPGTYDLNQVRSMLRKKEVE